MTTWIGTSGKLELLLSHSYTVQQIDSLELLLDSQEVDMVQTLLWPSEESSLKMQDITSVRVTTLVKYSHGDKELHKNLRYTTLHWYIWETLQLLIHTHTPHN